VPGGDHNDHPIETGKLLMEQRAGTVKKLSLELVATPPFIVSDGFGPARYRGSG
jgi:acyl-CoA reductase-like NAD-dependent aldehyde dehydrogenase